MKSLVIILCLIAVLTAGCGVYSFSSSALGGVKTIAVPQFDNKSLQPGIQEDLTRELINLYIQDNTLKIVGVADADAVLRGEVTKYENSYYTYTRGNEVDNVEEFKVSIWINFVLERKGGKVLLERDNVLGWGTYKRVGETDQDGQREAIAKLVRDIVDETTKSW